MVLESNFANWNQKTSNYAKHVLLLLILVFKKWYVPLSLHKPFNIYCVKMHNSIMRCLSLYWHFISFLWIWSFNTTIFTVIVDFYAHLPICGSKTWLITFFVVDSLLCLIFDPQIGWYESHTFHTGSLDPVYDYPLEQL